jgi:heterodisulfide reductase subunit A-like polyferredoxin
MATKSEYISLWIATSPDTHYPPPSLQKNIETDLVVVGGGIAGISTASLTRLKERNMQNDIFEYLIILIFSAF